MSKITLPSMLVVAFGLFLGTGLAKANNFKQIGIATSNYADSYRYFPHYSVAPRQARPCIDVAIISSPARVRAGSTAWMVAGVTNCGRSDTAVHLDAWLVDPDSTSRIHLGDERLFIRKGKSRRVRLQLSIPSGITPGRYMLLLTGETPDGHIDSARAPITVLPGPTLDVDRLLRRLDENPDDVQALEALYDLVESMLSDE